MVWGHGSAFPGVELSLFFCLTRNLTVLGSVAGAACTMGSSQAASVLVACPVQWGKHLRMKSGKCHPKLPRVVLCVLWEDTLGFGVPSPGKEVSAAGCVWTAPFFLLAFKAE